VVFRGLGGDPNLIGPTAMFKNGMHWHYNKSFNPDFMEPFISPQMGTQSHMISTTKLVRPAIHYAAMQMPDTNKRGYIYAIWCEYGIDYLSRYINNPNITRNKFIKGTSKAKFATNQRGGQNIELTKTGSGNEEIIMIGVHSYDVLCAREVKQSGLNTSQRKYWVTGQVYVNQKAKLKKKNPQLWNITIELFQNYPSTPYLFSKFSADTPQLDQ
jgi:hypothetical protein